MSLNDFIDETTEEKKPVKEKKKKKKPKKQSKDLVHSFAQITEDKKLIQKGRIRLHDFEIIPYRFAYHYVTGEVIEIDNPSMYVHPADQVIENELANGNIYRYRACSISFDFCYLVGTAKKLVYGDEDYRKDKEKQYDSFFVRTFFGIANRVHFQLKTDFGLVVWSFIRKRKKPRNIKMSAFQRYSKRRKN